MNEQVLVIEDEHDLQELMKYSLTRKGYEVTLATSAENALPLLRGRQFHLVILDIMMPGMDGFQFCRLIKSDATLRQVPVLMFTKQGAPGGRYMMLLHGFSPGAHRDPRMKKLAVSICDGTGIGVFIPRVDSFFRGKLAGSKVRVYPMNST